MFIKKKAYFILGTLLVFISINLVVYSDYFSENNESIIHSDSLGAPENELNSLHSSSSLTAKNAYAIVIGISDYPYTSYDLSYCDDDAQEVYDMLINEYNFKSENIIYLQDSAATKGAISSAFDTINAQINQDDVFFFYYSGHGGASLSNEGTHYYSIDSPHPYPDYYDNIWSIYHSDAIYMRVYFDHFETEYGYDWVYLGDTDLYSGWYYEAYSGYSTGFWSDWIPLLDDNRMCVRLISDYSITDWGFSIDRFEVMTYDGTHYLCSYDSIPSSPENYYIDTLIDAKLDAMNATEKYIITDSCNSGGIIPEVQSAGRYIMTACMDDESSLEHSSLQNGVFTNFFLESINNAVDTNGDGVRSMEECYSYAYSNTVSYSGSLGYTHHPQQSDGITGEAVLNTAFGGLDLVPTGNSLSYSFNMYGTGLIEDLRLVVYNNSAGINYNMIDLTETPASNTGFGSYSGSLQLDGFSGLSGYGIYAKISGNNEIILSETTAGDIDGDTLDDVIEIIIGTDPNDNDTDNDGLTDNSEYYGETSPILYDTDGDGMDDGYEVNNSLDPLSDDSDGDFDGDGLNNLLEYQLGIYANDIDSDNDGMPDGWEYDYGLNLTSDDSLDDQDYDNLTNLVEFSHNTDPLNNDTDNDGLFDGVEVNSLNSDPTLQDTDADELTDYEEVMIYLTNVTNPDTDGDIMLDGYEISNNLDPNYDDAGLDYDDDALSNLLEFQIGSSANDPDTDDDLIPDGYEYDNNLNPLANDANLDHDHDGLSNLLECQLGSYADDSDSDNDGMPDGWEYDYGLDLMLENANMDADNDGLSNFNEFNAQTNPIDPDTDDDGLNDNQEINQYLTDPTNPDSDGDGWNDGLEVMFFLDPLDSSISLFTLILNILGFSLVIALSISISRRHIKNKRLPKIPKKSITREIDEHDNRNILKLQKKMKPKPKVPTSYQARPVYRPQGIYTRPQSNLLPLSLNEIKKVILYGTPSPKSSYSEEGKRLIAIAERSLFDLSTGRVKQGLDGLILALMSGVPEPINSRIKVFLLDFLDKTEGNSPQTYTSANTKRCLNCGAINTFKNKYCVKCGRLL